LLYLLAPAGFSSGYKEMERGPGGGDGLLQAGGETDLAEEAKCVGGSPRWGDL